MNRGQQHVIEYLKAENQILREKLGKQRSLLTDNQRRRLAVKGKQLGRKLLAEVTTLVTPDTILRWHRQLVAQKWDHRIGVVRSSCRISGRDNLPCRDRNMTLRTYQTFAGIKGLRVVPGITSKRQQQSIMLLCPMYAQGNTVCGAQGIWRAIECPGMTNLPILGDFSLFPVDG